MSARLACAPAMILSLALAAAWSCQGDEPGDSGDTGGAEGPDDSGDTAQETGDTGGETGDSADTGDTGEPAGGDGLLLWEGTATVTADAYEGSEDILLLADMGLGDALCQVRYSVLSTSVRTDCGACLWAFDVVLGPAEVIEDKGACQLAGYDEAAIAAIEGSTRGYGYAEEHIGHAAVLLVDQGGGWDAVAFASWVEQTGAFSYEWEQAYVQY